MRTVTVTRMLLWAAVLSSGCTCRENVRPPATTSTKLPVGVAVDAQPAQTTAVPDATVPAAPDGSAAVAMLHSEPLQAKDDAVLAPLVEFAGGTVVRPGRRLLNDTQWVAVSCGPLAGTFELLRSSLQSQGWTEESTRGSDGTAEIQAVTAQRDGLSVSIVVQRSKRADCTGATVSMTAFRLQR